MESHNHAVEYLYDVQYSSLSERLKLDLFQPAHATEKLPLIIYIHGGGWVDRDKSTHRFIGENFASTGSCCVAVINYRLTEKSEPTVRYPDQLYDVVKSVEFLVGCGASITNGNAQLVRRYDNNNIVLMGHSAGGHMSVEAVITNLRHIRNHIRAVIGLQGLYDMITYYEDFPSFVDMFEPVFGRDRVLKSGSTEISAMLDGSPTRLILDQQALQEAIKIHTQQYDSLYPTSSGESDRQPVQKIRFLIVHSPQDTWVNPKQSEQVCTALKDKYPGVHVEYDHRPCGDHWDVVQSLQKKEIVDRYVQFIHHKE